MERRLLTKQSEALKKSSYFHINIYLQTMKQDKTIVLQTFSDFIEAKAMQNKLRENGITSSLTDENVLGMDPIAGVELKIFEKDKEAALKIISAFPGNSSVRR